LNIRKNFRTASVQLNSGIKPVIAWQLWAIIVPAFENADVLMTMY